jgi:pyruvate/2-oxoglutarate dehydrogenase complex dihydrolipoamide dehydrogenase (E3) component
VRRAPEFGIEAPLTGVDWPAIRDRTFSRIDEISAEGRRRSRAESDDVTLIEGRARFTGPHELATRTLLGAHVMGDQASLLIQPLIQAAATGQHVTDLARGQYWIHPALSEVVENALLKLQLNHPSNPAG